MLIIQHLTFASKILIWLLKRLKLRRMKFFNDLIKTQWKRALISVIFWSQLMRKEVFLFWKRKQKIIKSEKFLGVTIDNKLSFTKHVHKICDKASQKLNALAQLSSFLSLEIWRLIIKAFVNSQSGYCPLI